MDKKKIRLKGHESFVLREGWISKGLHGVEKDPQIFSEYSGADILGVGTNMGKSIRYWLRAAKLTRDVPKVGVVLTELGKLILKKDPYIEYLFTLFILHANISMNYEQATSWALFFNEFEANECTREVMPLLMRQALEKYTGNYDETFSERSISDDCLAICNMYLENDNKKGKLPEDTGVCPFVELGLLQKTAKYIKKVAPSHNKLSPVVLYYVILMNMNGRTSLSIDEIATEKKMPGKIFNLSRMDVYGYVEELSRMRLADVNRTAGLDMVYPNTMYPILDIVERYYGV